MRYLIFSTVFVSSMMLSSACGGSEAENVNTNVNQAVITSETGTENVNTNVKKADEPVPTFTDAAVAVAEGNKYLDASENEKAIEAYKQAVALNPDLAEAHFQLGVAYALVEKEEEAVEDKLPGEEEEEKTTKKSKKPVKEKKTNSELSFENAIKVYKKIVAKNSKDDVAFYNLGRAYNKLDEDEDAQKALQTAVKLQPENGEYQTEYGTILMKLAQYDEAIRALKKAVEIDEANLRAAEMLEQAQAGKKRVDFGANQIKQRNPVQVEEPREPRETRSPRRAKETQKPADAPPAASKTP